MNWLEVSKQPNLSESFIEEHKQQLDWKWISDFRLMDSDFLTKYKDYVHWDVICAKSYCTEHLIEELQYEIDWKCVAIHANISLPFIKKHIQYMEFGWLLENSHLKINQKEFFEMRQWRMDWYMKERMKKERIQ